MNMPVFKVSGRKRISQLVKWELNPDFCRQPYSLLAGSGAARIVTLGTILAMSFGAGAVDAIGAADAGNTGDGTIAMAAPATTSAVKPGVYSVVCTTGGIDGASKFRIEDPEGNHVSTTTGGTAIPSMSNSLFPVVLPILSKVTSLLLRSMLILAM